MNWEVRHGERRKPDPDDGEDLTIAYMAGFEKGKDQVEALRKQVAELTKELDEAGSNCVMYKQQVLTLKKERLEVYQMGVNQGVTIIELQKQVALLRDALEKHSAPYLGHDDYVREALEKTK